MHSKDVFLQQSVVAASHHIPGKLDIFGDNYFALCGADNIRQELCVGSNLLALLVVRD